MNVRDRNRLLLEGKTGEKGLLPYVEELREGDLIFNRHFGLDQLPEEGGLILIRGARQYGKSTWLELQIEETLRRFGPGSAFYLNGDEIRDGEELVSELRVLAGLFPVTARVRRIFIDEISSLPGWEKALKRLIDAGELRNVLLVTTGSKAADLRRGVERLPGRKGRLARTSFIFTPVSFREFQRVCGERLGGDTLDAYLLSGGSPVACAELARHGRLPEFATAAVSDWILGEMSRSGRSRSSLLGVLQALFRSGGSPLGHAQLAREAGLANNTVAQGYVDLLSDLLCVSACFAWDPDRRVQVRRKPCKFHFLNLLVAAVWHPSRPRTVADLRSLPPPQQGMLLEWLVAQELWRRASIQEADPPDGLAFWSSKEHELDFVVSPEHYLEVKRGAESPINFRWFLESHLKGKLTVINRARFEVPRIRGVTLEDFLLEEG